MSFCQILNPKQKALEINLNHKIYGTFAEIGAGQEVARHFFQAGGAAGTIAKTISAYDMTMSDLIYGKETGGRYVCEKRLVQMLDKEYEQLISRLKAVRSAETTYFVFANTVAAKSYNSQREAHGWMGVKFQDNADAEASLVVIHVKMLDKENVQQQEALGMIGVNLVHACYNFAQDSKLFIKSLMDGLTTDRLEIDMIRVSGPAFKGVDSRILSLELVKKKLCQAVFFTKDGEIMQVEDALYKKNVVLVRGSFRPPTLVNLDMLEKGHALFEKDLPAEEKKNILVLPEMSMSKLLERGEVDNDDFLARVDLLSELGYAVLITAVENFAGISQYLKKTCKKQLGIVLGVYNVEQLFSTEHHEPHPDGIIGSVSALVGTHANLYVYPASDDHLQDQLKTIASLTLPKDIHYFFDYLKENKRIQEIDNYDPRVSNIWSRTVLRMIQNNEAGWEAMVPELVAKKVKKDKLFRFN
jgi:hypothetical protein